jgi:hypothetical protein
VNRRLWSIFAAARQLLLLLLLLPSSSSAMLHQADSQRTPLSGAAPRLTAMTEEVVLPVLDQVLDVLVEAGIRSRTHTDHTRHP